MENPVIDALREYLNRLSMWDRGLGSEDEAVLACQNLRKAADERCIDVMLPGGIALRVRTGKEEESRRLMLPYPLLGSFRRKHEQNRSDGKS